MLRRISPYASLVASAASCASHCSRSGCKASASSSSASSSSASSSAATIRIATYNVLSDKLCRASHYPENSEDDLDNEKRLERVKAKLAEEMDKRAVVCLQEVSRHWGDKLVPFFEQRGYSYAGANYGNPFNGYMGCYVAWPRERYDAPPAGYHAPVPRVWLFATPTPFCSWRRKKAERPVALVMPKVSRVFRAPAGGWTVRSLFDAIAEGDEREWRGDHHFFEGLEKSSNGRYQSFWGS